MERINRLTEKSTNYDFYFPKKKVSILDLSAKLGKLEDLMEELNIDNVEELGEYIHDLNIYVGAYANDPPEKTQQKPVKGKIIYNSFENIQTYHCSCGRELSFADNYCGKCGTEIDWKEVKNNERS